LTNKPGRTAIPCFTWPFKTAIIGPRNDLEEPPSLNLEETSPFRHLAPVKYLRLGSVIVFIAIL
jgi:hypothetical protein